MHDDAQRQGLGTLLFRRLAQELNTMEFQSMAVWVLAANPFRRFYEALGGQIIVERPIERGGQFFSGIIYGWRDLNRLGGYTVPVGPCVRAE